MPLGRSGEGGDGRKKGNYNSFTCLVFNGCGLVLAPPLIKSIKNLLLWKKSVKSGKCDIDYVLLYSCEFRDILIRGLQVNMADEID